MRRMRPLLGTFVEIAAEGLDADGANEGPLEAAVDAAFEAVALVHRLMSLHGPDSDLSRINREAWRAPVEVHPWTTRTLRWALTVHQATDGLFDCAVGYELFHRDLRAGCGLEAARRGTLADVAIEGNRVRLARRIGLDLGGIAKGFAVDRAVATLRRRGVRSAIVNAGGDLRVMGSEAQPIYRREPGPAKALQFAGWLRNGAIATSSTDELVDRRAGAPMVAGETCSVLAPRCVIADALTKVVAQSGSAAYLDRFGATAVQSPPRARAA
jgi:thiamine biosynthesis lipoprotein